MNVKYWQKVNVVSTHEGYRAGQINGKNLIYLYIGNVVGLNGSRVVTIIGSCSGSLRCPNCLTDILCCFHQSIIVAHHLLPHSFQFIIYSLSYTEPEQLGMYKLGHGLDGQGIAFRFPAVITDFFLLQRVEIGLVAAQAPIQCVPWISLNIRRSGLEEDYAPASSAEAKNACSQSSIPVCIFMAWCVIRYRNNLNSSYSYQHQMSCSLSH